MPVNTTTGYLRVGLIWVATVGCGSRSAVLDLEHPATGGTGGTGGSTGGSAGHDAGGPGGAAGSGGVPRCLGLIQRDVRDLESIGEHHEGGPLLVQVAQASATLAFRRMPTAATPLDVPTLAHVTFDPWSNWNAMPIPGSAVSAHIGGESVAVGAGEGSTWSFLVRDDLPFTNADGLFFAPDAPSGPSVASPFELWPVSAAARFVAKGDGEHLVGFEENVGVAHQLAFGRTGNGFTPNTDSGCGTSRIFADAARVGSGYLLATSSSRPFGSCSDLDGVNSTPTRLQIARLEDGAASPTASFEFEDSGPIDWVTVIPRSDGAWVLWRPSTGVDVQGLRLLRIDPLGDPIGSPVSVTNGAVLGSETAAALADGLVVAYMDAFDPGPPTYVVQVLDPNGQVTATASVTPTLWGTPLRLAALGAPNADAVLLAWTAMDATSPKQDRSQVQVTRLDCAN